ncbi:hypothetical protein [Micrococcus lylae]|uniref:hypothetical protein n=1 Tax=Micrococcus lylae TaxID=1273 RepID=UPI000C804B28|nr:hypothetical protein [Micrococcus lylae]WIK82122.1 hypothetical protein CJ228_011140 [Micrococcus lylae]
MSGKPTTKVAKVFEGVILAQGQTRPAATPDWGNVLRRVKALPFEARTIKGIVYDPVETPAGWALSMHKPISPGYKSVLKSDSGDIEDWLVDSDSAYRFAYSTAVVFLGTAATFAICKGEHQAPGHPDVERFLEHFLEPTEKGAYWQVRAVTAPGQTPEFQAVQRVRSLDLAMTTRGDLFNGEARGSGTSLDGLLSAVADQVGADLQVRLHLSIEKAQRSTKPEQNLRGVVQQSMRWITSSGTRAVVETEDSSGVREALNLVTHNLAVDIALPPQSTERQSFRDIITGLSDQVEYLNLRLASLPSVH